MNSFLKLDPALYKGARLIIDLDGTLVVDGEYKISSEFNKKIREFLLYTEIYLCSNGHPDRTRALSESLGVFYITSQYKKPSKKIMCMLPGTTKRIIVIGDKFSTDGRLAENIGAEFIKIERVRSYNETIWIRISYLFDDVLSRILPFIRICRPFQWPKNSLVFAPLFFGLPLVRSTQTIVDTSFAFIIFSIAASVIYVFNDLCDLETDKLHQYKKYRPLAAGTLVKTQACIFMIILSVALVLFLIHYPVLISVIVGYLILNLFYTLVLKHIPGFDILCVAVFYYLRIVAGEVVTSVLVHPFIIVCIFSGALFIISGKRWAESMQLNRRKVLNSYSPKVLAWFTVITSITVIAAYVGYTLQMNFFYLNVSILPVTVIVGRIFTIIYRYPQKAEMPELLLFRDKIIILSVIFWAYCLILL